MFAISYLMKILLLWSGHFLNVFLLHWILFSISAICPLWLSEFVSCFVGLHFPVNIIHDDIDDQCCTELSVTVCLEERRTKHKKYSLGKSIMIIWLKFELRFKYLEIKNIPNLGNSQSAVQSTHVAPYISPQASSPLRRERLLDRSCVSLMWAVNAMAIQWQDKKPSLSVSWSSNAICSLRAKHKQRTALFGQNNRR